jgi:hypothetical protein
MNSEIGGYTDALFARPTFFSGAARALDRGGAFDEYNSGSTSEDSLAIASDSAAVGRDLGLAIENLVG